MLGPRTPSCGDQCDVFLRLDGYRIAEISFEGSGCAISQASASLMTTQLKGKTAADAERLYGEFHEIVTTGKEPECLERWDAAPVTAVDSCGAGDTFHGAYAWAVAKGLAPAECFATAAWSAGLKISQLGNEGIPTLAQLEDARASIRAGERA